MMRCLERDFVSQGVRCAGTLYLPDRVSPPPVVVLGHGFGGERAWGLPRFAERFAEAGIAAFLLDYRGFGDSDGEPRRVVSPRRHLEDFTAALAHVRAMREVDPDQIVLWGTSLGGGHAVTLAARHPDIAAVIAHVPHVDTLASLRQLGDPMHILKLTAAGLRDLGHMVTGREPYYVDNVGRPGALAMLNTEDSWDGFMTLIPEGEPFDNRCAARIALTIPFYRPIASSGEIEVPTLIVAAVRDSLIPIASVRKTAQRIPGCELVELDCRHFEPYTGAWFEKSIAAQLGFLSRVLGAAASV